jgi:hypothetical protein
MRMRGSAAALAATGAYGAALDLLDEIGSVPSTGRLPLATEVEVQMSRAWLMSRLNRHAEATGWPAPHTISCMVSDLRFAWRLDPVDRGTRISVHVEIPEREAARVDMQRDVIESSLRKLAELATQP